MRPGLLQILLVILLIFILFGSSKIPDMMRNLASGLNVFKKELKDDKKEDITVQTAAAPAHKKLVAKKTAVKKAIAKKSVSQKGGDKKSPAKKSAAKKAAKK